MRKAYLCCLDPDTSIRCLEVNGTNVPFKGFSIVFISELYFLIVLLHPAHMGSSITENTGGIKFIIISNNKNFITVLWVRCCLLIYLRAISLLWGSGLSSGWAFLCRGFSPR